MSFPMQLVYAEIQWNQCIVIFLIVKKTVVLGLFYKQLNYSKDVKFRTSISASTSQLWPLLYRRVFGVTPVDPVSCFFTWSLRM